MFPSTIPPTNKKITEYYVKFASRSVLGLALTFNSLVNELLSSAHRVIPSPRPKAERASSKSLVQE